MKYFIISIFIFSHLAAFSQKKLNRFTSDSWFKENLYAQPVKKGNATLLQQINQVYIRDQRFETSSWGVIQRNKAVFKIIPPGSAIVEKVFQEYVNNKFNYNPAATYSLFAIIRHFCFSNERKKSDLDKHIKQPLWLPGVAIKIDFYLKKENQYFPWFRFNEDYMLSEKNASKQMNEILSSAIDFAFQKIEESNSIVIQPANKTKLTAEEVERTYTETTQLPILLADTLEKGVYTSFEEFKLNKPSIKNYRIEKSNVMAKLIIEKNGQEYPLKNVWGFCDGDRIFI